jgi:hypothetical protein
MVRREGPLDAARIVQSLARHDVDYVLIGGLAVQAHGHVRTTQDADVLPERSEENLSRLADALHELNARPAGSRGAGGAMEVDLKALRGTAPLALDSDAGGVDIHPSPPGGGRYEEIHRRALVLTVAGVDVRFAGLDDLIAMKRAARRPVDLGDIAALTEAERGGAAGT